MAKRKSKSKRRDKEESDPIELLKRTATAINRDPQAFTSAFPLSSFKTPYVDSSRWAEVERIGKTDNQPNEFKKNPGEVLAEDLTYDIYANKHDPYPAWNPPEQVPITKEAIEAIFLQLTTIFGFQFDNTRNMFDYLLRLLDSRASRLGPTQALKSVHADYIGGVNANFRKWYFAASLDIDDAIGFDNVTKSGRVKDSNEYVSLLEEAEEQWSTNMLTLSPTDCVIQLALYLLVWGEANNIRFMPECICFIFKCCNDYYFSIDPDIPVTTVTRSFLDHIITPLYDFYRDQSYVLVEGKYHRRDKDHESVIGYDDMNQLFWYSKGLERLVLSDKKTKLMTLQPHERYEKLNEILWHKAFYKTFRERRSWSHVLVNFNRVWIIHVSVFWYYTLFNSPTLYTKNYQPHVDNQPTNQARLAVLSLAGSVAILICMFSLILELSFVPRKWAGAQTVIKRLFFLFLCLLINTGPTVYLFLMYPLNIEDTIGLVIASFQFAFSILVVMYLSIVPLGKLFTRTARENDRRYLPTQYFITNFYQLTESDRIASYGLWFAIFVSKFIESYFFLTLSMRDPVRELSVMKMTRCAGENVKAKLLVSQVWNSIVISMYREHLISLEHVQKLIYKQIDTPGIEGGSVLKEPIFFVSQEDQSIKSSLFQDQSEAQRRVTFFAQSLSTPMPEVGPVQLMPSFTVLIPHYGEKITLSLREIIREEEQYSHVTMLEYLKQLHPIEWSCFVKDTKMLAEEFETDSSSAEFRKEKLDDLPYYSVGFKIATPEYILRTRIWASLRSQTLYRTISGFMNYSRAIKLLFDVENPNSAGFQNEQEKLEQASIMAHRKFRIITSMQRLKYFTQEEKENTEFLLRAYPELQICYLDEEVDEATGEVVYFSSLVDGSCAIMENGEREPKYKIRLSGNPILGDGKSDNQNHSLIFCRGEYIQLVDANQDNYLEECLKIRSVLAEFEEATFPIDPYAKDLKNTEMAYPVAIIGTREYIFSENIGILGDVAAGKEQTFGTLFARTLAHIGGKLHYGHPDFLNGIFMTTRGGVSKAQKGLHLNEDIYAGMNVVLRGGRIKHCEYMQCGKGRDLGFGSILNFTTKIGAGMGEQMLSREYFYLGTQLPLDRFLSFYYAHPGFHLNNVFIMLSIQLFLLVVANLAALTNESTICEYDRYRPITDPRRPVGCYNLIPVVHWLERCIFSIFIVFVISFVPLGVQELTERGFYKAITRLGKQFASFSPLFEVFVCRIYAHSLVSDISIGGARYLATGRGFATIRVPFSTLYSRFAVESLYYGSLCGLLIFYGSISMWKLSLLYFWITIIGLMICPFLYNPNQFSWKDFFLDYKEYLRWLYRGNSKPRISSWINFTRLRRSRIVGVKSKRYSLNEEIKVVSEVKPSRFSLVISESLQQLGAISVVAFAYLFSNSQNDARGTYPVNSILRMLIVTFGPIVVNFAILLACFVISAICGPLLTLFCKKFPSFVAAFAHILALINHVFFFELLWMLQNWNFSRTILGFALSVLIQRWFLQMITILFISREFRHDRSNRSWWSGKWATAGLGWYIITQPLRETICKLTELSYFAGDLVAAHLILYAQIPILLIPYADKWHTLMLFWLKPGNQIRPRILSKKQKRKRRFQANLYLILFLFGLILFSSIFAVPIIVNKYLDIDFESYAPSIMHPLFQPYILSTSRKGLLKSLEIRHY
ncbi:GSL2 [[Candida] subhashii]|uniref:1,3-beta-glucan synthase n=1 Tax=[Candida] subhashii TaxID=561895 RepID=A0A8J5UYL9_9ASCO|nr:GSL2 [[Candida] subhashii]KAG7663184.1 GSL2 [[Candida] subhashii]